MKFKKLYILGILSVFVFTTVFGFLGPMLISSESDIEALLGVLVIIVGFPLFVKTLSMFGNEFKKLNKKE